MRREYISTCSYCGKAPDYSKGWMPDPGDPIYTPGCVHICDDCREKLERNWLVKATPEQLLLAVNYEWAPIHGYPRYSMSVKEMYQRLLAGESFSHIRQWTMYL